jgi:hypothetical protein
MSRIRIYFSRGWWYADVDGEPEHGFQELRQLYDVLKLEYPHG